MKGKQHSTDAAGWFAEETHEMTRRFLDLLRSEAEELQNSAPFALVLAVQIQALNEATRVLIRLQQLPVDQKTSPVRGSLYEAVARQLAGESVGTDRMTTREEESRPSKEMATVSRQKRSYQKKAPHAAAAVSHPGDAATPPESTHAAAFSETS